jgi:hypothetical protein
MMRAGALYHFVSKCLPSKVPAVKKCPSIVFYSYAWRPLLGALSQCEILRLPGALCSEQHCFEMPSFQSASHEFASKFNN